MANLIRIAYCDHSFHRKTKSTSFLIDILRTHPDVVVDLYWDDAWEGGESVYFSQIAHYDIIIIFQAIPAGLPKCLAKNHKNVIFVPMLDQLGIAMGPLFNLDYFWKPFRGSKVLSFSTAINAIAISNGIASQYFQYMPDSGKHAFIKNKNCAKGNPLKVFYWMRKPSDIPPESISLLLSGISNKYSIHVHLVPDPGQAEISIEDVLSAFNKPSCISITTSHWFETKEELYSHIKESDIFIASRLEEGIGQSFLEALTLGLCVVSPNNGTMNEYIVNGLNGLLYDPSRPEQLDFDNIENISANARTTALQLSKTWRHEKKQLLDFILRPSAECYQPNHKYYKIEESLPPGHSFSSNYRRLLRKTLTFWYWLSSHSRRRFTS